MKKILLILMSLMLMLTGCNSNEKKALTAKDYKSIENASITTKEEGEEKKDMYEIVVNRPTVEIKGKEVFSKTINDELNSAIDEHLKSIEWIKEKTEDEDEFPRISAYTTTIGNEIYTNKNGILSMNLNFYEYTGGAHGMYGSVQYNYDLASEKQIELADLFNKELKESGEYLDIIFNEIEKKLKEKENEYGVDSLNDYYKKGEGIVPEFFIKNDKINIYFGVYEIASYAEGEQIFEIPVEAVKESLSTLGKVVYDVL
ncbi:DUF3298 and DUF4163 domain-containing protein [Peptostreptococcaceae bacterium AGR-M142]